MITLRRGSGLLQKHKYTSLRCDRTLRKLRHKRPPCVERRIWDAAITYSYTAWGGKKNKLILVKLISWLCTSESNMATAKNVALIPKASVKPQSVQDKIPRDLILFGWLSQVILWIICSVPSYVRWLNYFCFIKHFFLIHSSCFSSAFITFLEGD